MKTTKLKTSVAFGLAAIFLIVPHVDGQGLFGWKKKSQPNEEGNPNLFPGTASPGYVSSSEPSAPRDSAIFKSDQPVVVRETNYIIKDGVRVPTPKRRPFFKRNTKGNSPTVPAPNAPAPVYPETRPNLTPATPPAPTSVAPPANKERRKVFPRLRKKEEVISPYDDSAASPSPDATTSDSPVTFDPTPEAEKEVRLGPLAKFRLKRGSGPVDTSRSEILVNDGGTLVRSGSNGSDDVKITDRIPVTSSGSGSGPTKPPQEVEGSVVYDSWDDVASRKTSAADQIVSQMKAQEAAHRRKVTAAKKAYEEKVRKAEEDARIRAIMQGGLPPAP